jgi:hypothetical protein
MGLDASLRYSLDTAPQSKSGALLERSWAKIQAASSQGRLTSDRQAALLVQCAEAAIQVRSAATRNMYHAMSPGRSHCLTSQRTVAESDAVQDTASLPVSPTPESQELPAVICTTISLVLTPVHIVHLHKLQVCAIAYCSAEQLLVSL